VALTAERDKWYGEVLALGDRIVGRWDELQTLRTNRIVRLCAKLRLMKPPKRSVG